MLFLRLKVLPEGLYDALEEAWEDEGLGGFEGGLGAVMIVRYTHTPVGRLCFVSCDGVVFSGTCDCSAFLESGVARSRVYVSVCSRVKRPSTSLSKVKCCSMMHVDWGEMLLACAVFGSCLDEGQYVEETIKHKRQEDLLCVDVFVIQAVSSSQLITSTTTNFHQYPTSTRSHT